MAHPYKSAAHKKDPSWLNGIKKYVDGDRGVSNEVIGKINTDTDATIRNYGGDKKTTAKATYERKEEQK